MQVEVAGGEIWQVNFVAKILLSATTRCIDSVKDLELKELAQKMLEATALWQIQPPPILTRFFQVEYGRSKAEWCRIMTYHYLEFVASRSTCDKLFGHASAGCTWAMPAIWAVSSPWVGLFGSEQWLHSCFIQSCMRIHLLIEMVDTLFELQAFYKPCDGNGTPALRAYLLRRCPWYLGASYPLK